VAPMRKGLRKGSAATLACAALMALGARPASAELAFFANGSSLSIKAHRIEGDSLVLGLRGGGEMVLAVSAIVRIAPDEVPYPEPEASKPDVVADTRHDAPAVTRPRCGKVAGTREPPR